MSKDPSHSEIRFVLSELKRRFPEPGAMELGNAYQALVGVLLSARTRDEQVIKLLPRFFQRFSGVHELAKATVDEIASYINTIGMYRQKAKHLKGMAERVLTIYGGEIPSSMEDLVTLPGVGRKTASVILPYIYGKPAIAVDTHVHRVTNRLGWVLTTTPEKTEKALLDIVPKECQYPVNQVMVKFGRYICLPGNPRCWTCPLVDICPFAGKRLDRPKNADAVLRDIQMREAELVRLRDQVKSFKKE